MAKESELLQNEKGFNETFSKWYDILMDERKAKKALWFKRRYNNLSLSRKVRGKQFDRAVQKEIEEAKAKKVALLNLD